MVSRGVLWGGCAILLIGGLVACGSNDHPSEPTPRATLQPTLDISQIPILGEETPPPLLPLTMGDPRYPIPPATGETLAAGKRLYEQHCALCHGVNGEGEQPDPLAPGAAPPHNADGHTWHHADQQNFATVWYGRGAQGTMPPFYNRLTPDEIIQVLAYIKTWWEADELAQQIELTQRAADAIANP